MTTLPTMSSTEVEYTEETEMYPGTEYEEESTEEYEEEKEPTEESPEFVEYAQEENVTSETTPETTETTFTTLLTSEKLTTILPPVTPENVTAVSEIELTTESPIITTFATTYSATEFITVSMFETTELISLTSPTLPSEMTTKLFEITTLPTMSSTEVEYTEETEIYPGTEYDEESTEEYEEEEEPTEESPEFVEYVQEENVTSETTPETTETTFTTLLTSEELTTILPPVTPENVTAITEIELTTESPTPTTFATTYSATEFITVSMFETTELISFTLTTLPSEVTTKLFEITTLPTMSSTEVEYTEETEMYTGTEYEEESTEEYEEEEEPTEESPEFVEYVQEENVTSETTPETTETTFTTLLTSEELTTILPPVTPENVTAITEIELTTESPIITMFATTYSATEFITVSMFETTELISLTSPTLPSEMTTKLFEITTLPTMSSTEAEYTEETDLYPGTEYEEESTEEYEEEEEPTEESPEFVEYVQEENVTSETTPETTETTFTTLLTSEELTTILPPVTPENVTAITEIELTTESPTPTTFATTYSATEFITVSMFETTELISLTSPTLHSEMTTTLFEITTLPTMSSTEAEYTEETEMYTDTEYEEESTEEYEEEEEPTEAPPVFVDYVEEENVTSETTPGTSETTYTTLSFKAEHVVTTEIITVSKETLWLTTESPTLTSPVTTEWNAIETITTSTGTVESTSGTISGTTSWILTAVTSAVTTRIAEHTESKLSTVMIYDMNTTETTSLHIETPPATTEAIGVNTSHIATPQAIIVVVTIPNITSMTVASYLPEITTTPITFTESVTTIAQSTATTEEEAYGETEKMVDDEYAEEYKLAYEGEDEEEEITEVFTPIWHDYVEENFTIPEIVDTPTTGVVIHVEVSIMASNETVAPETPETTVALNVTMETLNITTVVYTLPPTSEYTTEYLPLEYVGGTKDRESEVTTEAGNVTLAEHTEIPMGTLFSQEVFNPATEATTRSLLFTELTTYKFKVPTDKVQQQIRHEELKKELLVKLDELEKNEERLLEKEEQLLNEEKVWEEEKVVQMEKITALEEQIEMFEAITASSKPESFTRRPTSILAREPTGSHQPTVLSTAPLTLEPTTVMTTEDMLEKEVRMLEDELSHKEEKLKEKEDSLSSREKTVQKEKEDLGKKIQVLKDQLAAKKMDVKPPGHTEKPESATKSAIHTTPSITLLPPTEGTTTEIQGTTIRRITLNGEEDEEMDNEDYRPQNIATSRICLNVLKNPSLGKHAENLVTHRVCLPFVPGDVGIKGGRDEKGTKIEKLHLGGPEWGEGAFTKGHGSTEEESLDEERDRRRAISDGKQDRFKRSDQQRLSGGIGGAEAFVEPGKIEEVANAANGTMGTQSYCSSPSYPEIISLGNNRRRHCRRGNGEYKKRSILGINEEDDERVIGEGENNEGDSWVERDASSWTMESIMAIDRDPMMAETAGRTPARGNSPYSSEQLRAWDALSPAHDGKWEARRGKEIKPSRDNSLMRGISDGDVIESVAELNEDEMHEVTDALNYGVAGDRSYAVRSANEDDEDEDPSKLDKSAGERQTPGPEWPTEPVTQYHVGGTRTWTLMFPEDELREELQSGQRDSGSDDKEALKPSTCLYVILGRGTESPDEDYSDEG
ncbi:uncharacterized protein LOC143370074 [Andrena cerasifolii]|uniref:uncharacterized protein LOC143370074 n=1 Tax=Andrena cerasifolii TaxID=2819439 RepID=UPI004037A735